MDEDKNKSNSKKQKKTLKQAVSLDKKAIKLKEIETEDPQVIKQLL